MGVKDWVQGRFQRERANPVGGLISQPHQRSLGVGDDWAPRNYGEYMLTSVPVYAAIQIRATSVSRPPLKVYRQVVVDGKVEREWVGPDHEAQQLLDKVNPHWTRGDLWRATETYLGLWGSAYWAVERDARGVPYELWPLRPDRVRVIQDAAEYIKGYLYTGVAGQSRAFAADEIVRLRYFNPMDEYSGLSPINAVRLSLDMGSDALKGNRTALANDSTPGLVFETQDTPTEEEVKEFYEHWDYRFKGPNNRMRPALLSAGMKAANMGFSPKDMQHLESLRWTVEDVARVYNVPKPMLHDLERATYANIETARRMFWEMCIVPQLVFYQEALQEYLLPMFNDPSLVVEFDLSRIEALQENENERSLRLWRYTLTGIMTPNEARAEINLPPVDQEGADELKLSSGGDDQFADEFRSITAQRPRKLPRRMRAMEPQEIGREVEAEFVRALVPRERQMRDVLKDLFSQQTEDMLKRLEASRSAHAVWREVTLVEALAAANVGIVDGHQRDEEDIVFEPVAQTAGLRLFNPSDWEPVFLEAGRPLVREAVETAARRVATKFALGIAFDVQRPIAQRWIEDRLKFWAGRVNQTTAELVVDVVKKANEEGLGIAQIRDKLMEVGEFNSSVRAEMIARTEMVSAQNEGHLQAYEQAEVEYKEWLTAGDERVRDSHQVAHGQVRRVREDFDVGGTKLRAPGQGNVAAEVINCRCVALPRFEA